MPNNDKNTNNVKKNKITSRRYDIYSETGYNARTCLIKID